MFGFVTDLLNTLTGGLFDLAGSAASRVADYETWYKQQSQLQAFQKDMIDYQNEATKGLQEHTWKNYNSPEAIMNAYQKAGINPNLVAGKVTGNSSAPTSASGGISAASLPKYEKGYSLLYQQQKQMKLQTEYQEQAVELREQEIEKGEIEIEKLYSDIMSEEYEVEDPDFSENGLRTTRPATKFERLVRGLENRNMKMNSALKAEMNESLARDAKALVDKLRHNLDKKQMEMIEQDPELWPLLNAAMSAKEDRIEKHNKNAISAKSIGDEIDRLDIPNVWKLSIKAIIARYLIRD